MKVTSGTFAAAGSGNTTPARLAQVRNPAGRG
jgi:hypothetical protein